MMTEAPMSSVARSRCFGGTKLAVAALLTVVALSFATVAHAAAIRIVALGASNTNGKGVGAGQAWPAVLERMLRAKGYDATVTVVAVNGLTSSGILGSVDSAVAPGTQVVIFDLGRHNDLKRNVAAGETGAN